MHIGYFSTILGRKGGPAIVDHHAIEQIAQLDRRNRYTIYGLTPQATAALRIENENVDIRLVKPGGKWLGVACGLSLELKRRPVDLLHATYVPPPIVPGKMVLTMTCWSQYSEPEVYPALIRWRLRYLLDRGVKQATALFCYTEFLKTKVVEHFGFDPERIFVTRPGVTPEVKAVEDEAELEHFLRGQGIDRPYVLFIGTLTMRKNVHRLVHAFHRLVRQERIPHQLVLVGEKGFLSDEIFEAIEELGIGDRVVLTGRRPYSDLRYYYTGADVFCLPTISEGYGLPPLEANACGTPVVASNVTSVPEVVGDAGVLVDPYDPEDIAAGLHKAITDDALRDDLIRKGLANAQRLTWANMAKQMLAGYEAIEASG